MCTTITRIYTKDDTTHNQVLIPTHKNRNDKHTARSRFTTILNLAKLKHLCAFYVTRPVNRVDLILLLQEATRGPIKTTRYNNNDYDDDHNKNNNSNNKNKKS